MATLSDLEQFYTKVPDLGNLIGSRMRWQKIPFSDWEEHVYELYKRGIFGLLPFVSSKSGTLALYLEPGQSLQSARVVFAFSDFPECMTIADHYEFWLIGLLSYEDWAIRNRGAELDYELLDIATALGTQAAKKFEDWLLAEIQIKSLETRAERIAWGFDFISESKPNMQFISQLWALRKEAVAQEAGNYLKKYGVEQWILPVRVFAGYLALRNAPIDLQSYAEAVFYNQQLNDATYLGYHQGNVPGSWSDRSEVRLSNWLSKNTKISSEHHLFLLIKRLNDEQEAYQGEQHLALAKKIKKEHALRAYYLTQASMIYQEKGDFEPQLTELQDICETANWSLLTLLLKAIGNYI